MNGDSLTSEHRLAAALVLLAEHLSHAAESLLSGRLTESERTQLATSLTRVAHEVRPKPGGPGCR